VAWAELDALVGDGDPVTCSFRWGAYRSGEQGWGVLVSGDGDGAVFGDGAVDLDIAVVGANFGVSTMGVPQHQLDLRVFPDDPGRGSRHTDHVPSLIDTYITELGNALRGPRRAKADLLTEARDSLVDAADAYQREGADRAAAERAAVSEFGALREIVPGYQAELGLTQGRRTALLVLFVFAAQPFIWGYAFRWATNTSNADSRTGSRLADDLVKNLGGVTLLMSMLAVLGYWIGLRYPAVRDRLTRITGVFAMVVAGVFVAFAAFLTLFGAEASTLPLVINVVWTVAFIVIPMSVIAVSAHSCLASLTHPPSPTTTTAPAHR
jgi:hypothetical protein